MKIFICASKFNYTYIPEIKLKLEEIGHIITLPNSFENAFFENEIKEKSPNEHIIWKQEMLRLQSKKVGENDAILVLNFDKAGMRNYIGGATFLEVYEAFRQGKKIFFYNELPDGILHDELVGINPLVINGNLDLIK